MTDDKNKLSKIKNGQSPSVQFDKEIYDSIRATLAEARTSVVIAVNSAMVSVYWEIGKQIADAVGERAEYGRRLLAYLSERLTAEFGKGFTVANLRNMRQFYQVFSIRYALRSELTWIHYRMLMRVDEPVRREFYLKECVDESIVKYSVLADKENLFASKYRLYPPTEEELKAELQRERERIERKLLLDGE